jgi:hypothetical protein
LLCLTSTFYPVVEPILEILDAILWPDDRGRRGGRDHLLRRPRRSRSRSRDEQNSSREKAKKDLVGAIVGFVIIFVLILALKIAVPILENWVRAQM